MAPPGATPACVVDLLNGGTVSLGASFPSILFFSTCAHRAMSAKRSTPKSFPQHVLEKARRVRAKLRDDQRLQIDGGVKPSNVAACRESGCDVLVAASAIYKTHNYAAAIAVLRGEVTAVAGNA